MENVFESFTVTVLKINKLIQKIKQREMSEYGLKGIHAMCLYYLNNGERITASELMRLTLEDKAAISRALKQLGDGGYVQYDYDTYNAAVQLTQKGAEVAKEVIGKTESAVKAVSANFTEDERLFFYSALNEICENLQKYGEEILNND